MSKSWELKVDKTIAKTVHAAAARGIAIAGEHVLGEANKTVPIEEGTPGLLGSGTVSTDPANLKAAVTYDTPYAKRQHEEMSYRHDEGRRAKWLELTMAEESGAVQKIIAATIRGEF